MKKAFAAGLGLWALAQAGCGGGPPAEEPRPLTTARIHPQAYLQELKAIGSLATGPAPLSRDAAAALLASLAAERGLQGFLGLPDTLSENPLALRFKLAEGPVSLLEPGLVLTADLDPSGSQGSPGILTAFDPAEMSGVGWMSPPDPGLSLREGTLFNVTVFLRRVPGACLVPREALKGPSGARVLRIYDPGARRVSFQPVTVLAEQGAGWTVAPAPGESLFALMTEQPEGQIPPEQIVEVVDPLALQARAHWSVWIKDVAR